MGNPAKRLFERLLNNPDSDLLIIRNPHIAEIRRRANQGDTATGHDAFFNRRASGMQRVFDARLLFFHFDFGRRANFDDGNATGELGQTFLQFLAVVVGSRFFDLRADLRDAAFDSGFLAGAFDNRGVVLVDDYRVWRGQDP